MKRLDAEKSGRFARQIEADLRTLPRYFKDSNWRKMAQLMGDESVVLLLKSRQIFQGKAQIADFWRRLKKKGVKAIRFEIIKQVPTPADFLLEEPDMIGIYARYDMVSYVFARFNLIFNSPSESKDLVVIEAHKEICKRGALLLVIEM